MTVQDLQFMGQLSAGISERRRAREHQDDKLECSHGDSGGWAGVSEQPNNADSRESLLFALQVRRLHEFPPPLAPVGVKGREEAGAGAMARTKPLAAHQKFPETTQSNGAEGQGLEERGGSGRRMWEGANKNRKRGSSVRGWMEFAELLGLRERPDFAHLSTPAKFTGTYRDFESDSV